MGTPIYYVIAEDKPIYPGMWACYSILDVVPCDFEEDARRIYEEKVAPLYNAGSTRRIQVFYFVREPDNPFRSFVPKEDTRSVWDI